MVLLMFDCPFFFHLPIELLGKDNAIQAHLDEWRRTEGEDWLETLGPMMKNRELKNMQRKTLKNSSDLA